MHVLCIVYCMCIVWTFKVWMYICVYYVLNVCVYYVLNGMCACVCMYDGCEKGIWEWFQNMNSRVRGWMRQVGTSHFPLEVVVH